MDDIQWGNIMYRRHCHAAWCPKYRRPSIDGNYPQYDIHHLVGRPEGRSTSGGATPEAIKRYVENQRDLQPDTVPTWQRMGCP